MRHISKKLSIKALGTAVAISLLLVACGDDDNNADGGVGSNQAPVTPTEQSEEPTSENMEQGAVNDGSTAETTPTRIQLTPRPGTPPSGQMATPRTGSDGSMSVQSSGTPDDTTPIADATPVASPPSATPEAD